MRWIVGLVLSLVAGASLADAPPAAPATPPLSIWVPEKEGYRHLQSNMLCPASFHGYHRTEASIFDDYGLDVGCNYAGPSRGVTLYLTKRSASGLDTAMSEARRELLQFGADKHPQAIGDRTVSANGLNWNVALYGEDGGLHSAIWITDLDGWTLEYRATYLATDEDTTNADLGVMTETVKTSAAPTLEACAKSKTPQRPGSLITNQKENSAAAMMSSLLGGAALAAAQDPKNKDDVKEEPLFWCPESPLKSASGEILLWRAVKADGSEGLSDKLSLMTQDEPPVLMLSADSLAGLVEAVNDKSGKTSDRPVHWTASLETHGQVLIFAYFDDRPSPDQAIALFDQVLSGKAKALGGYSVKGKNVNITVPDR